MIKSKIGIVILNYLVFQDTIECVESIKKQNFYDYEIVIVDNCSNNNSYELLLEKYLSEDNIFLLKTKENLGFSKANNFGIKILKARNIFNILVINADTVLMDVNFLKKLSMIDYDSHCAMIGTSIIGKCGNNQNPYLPMGEDRKRITQLKRNNRFQLAKLVLTPKFLWKPLRSLKHIFVKNNRKESMESIYLDLENQSLHGAAIFFTEHYLKKYVGFFPETFLYSEEDYLALICKKLGMKQLYVPKLQIYHKEGNSNLASSNGAKRKSLISRFTRVLKAIEEYEYNLSLSTDEFVDKFKDSSF